MLGCDDEFYIPSALNSCLIKLYSDSNFVACSGRAIGFGWSNDLVIGFNEYNKLKDLILDDPSPMVRLRKHFSNYIPAHIYAVCRSATWKIAAKYIFSKEYNEVNICSEAGFIPFEMRTTTGKWIGYDIALVKMFSEDTERKINLIKIRNQVKEVQSLKAIKY
jgi:hypothetical protein